MLVRVALFSALVLFGGCQARGFGESFMSKAEIDAKDDAACASFGAEKGTSAYVDCRLRLTQNRSHEASSRRIAGALQ